MKRFSGLFPCMYNSISVPLCWTSTGYGLTGDAVDVVTRSKDSSNHAVIAVMDRCGNMRFRTDGIIVEILVVVGGLCVYVCARWLGCINIVIVEIRSFRKRCCLFCICRRQRHLIFDSDDDKDNVACLLASMVVQEQYYFLNFVVSILI